MKKFMYRYIGSLCLAFAAIVNVIGLTSYGQAANEEMPTSMKNLR